MRRAFRSAIAAFAIAYAASSPQPAAAVMLPRLEADAFGGSHVVLPSDADGKPLIILLAFTKECEDQMKAWTRKLLQDHVAQNAVVYVVVVADKTAFFEHKHVRKMVEGAAVGSKEQIASNVLITFNGSGWRDLVPPGDKTTVGIVVCDASGDIVYAKREPFSDSSLADVEKAAK